MIEGIASAIPAAATAIHICMCLSYLNMWIQGMYSRSVVLLPFHSSWQASGPRMLVNVYVGAPECWVVLRPSTVADQKRLNLTGSKEASCRVCGVILINTLQHAQVHVHHTWMRSVRRSHMVWPPVLPGLILWSGFGKEQLVRVESNRFCFRVSPTLIPRTQPFGTCKENKDRMR